MNRKTNDKNCRVEIIGKKYEKSVILQILNKSACCSAKMAHKRNQFKLVLQSRQQALRAYCPNILYCASRNAQAGPSNQARG